jgi:hypothetical protein
MSRFYLFISCLFLLAPLFATGCDVVWTLYGAPGCNDLKAACGYSMVEDGGCLNFTLPDKSISTLINCTNQQTTFYEGEGCTGATPLASDVPSTQCATATNWYFTIAYDQTVCSAASSVESTSFMPAMLSAWIGF